MRRSCNVHLASQRAPIGTPARRLIGILLAALCVLLLTESRSEVPEPEVSIALSRVDVHDGKILWSSALDRMFRPYRCEVYPNRVVAFLYRLNKDGQADLDPETSQMVFFDSRTGAHAIPFDTRQFTFPRDDPQIGRSRFGEPGSTREERLEISLQNGWFSYVVARLEAHHEETNFVYFFGDEFQLKWKLLLPDGVRGVSHWNDVLVFRHRIEEKHRLVDYLVGQIAGRPGASWTFALPDAIPSRDVVGSDYRGPTNYLRTFSYFVGKNEVFVFGSGTLFALHPETGSILWEHSVSSDSIVRNAKVSFLDAEIVEADGDLILTSDDLMIRFDPASKRTIANLRSDLYPIPGPTPIYADGSIYCFRIVPNR